ncbi:MAG: hypothetical protein HY816_21995 [Candidatus Wallbacteria bacterium]|nr:hypothetical protein [Candidatus Wallbacteria bacterium]
MSRPDDHTPGTAEDLASKLAALKDQILELARRLARGDNAVYRTLKHQRHALKQLEQTLRDLHKRQRRHALTVELA